MNTAMKCFCFGLLILVASSSGNTQTASCGTDKGCLTAQAIFKATHDRPDSGAPEFAIGTLCANPALIAKGRAMYNSTLQKAIQDADANLVSALPVSTDYNTARAQLTTTVRLARSSEASGILAGLKSVMAMYPGTKGEFCARMVQKLSDPASGL